MLGCRSVENQMFVASANLVGEFGGMQHIGHSVIMGPKPGCMNYQVFAGPACETKEEIVSASLDLGSVVKTPYAVADALKERQPKIYHYLTSDLPKTG